jgi:tetratricopeptide (TPR) repeat protein
LTRPQTAAEQRAAEVDARRGPRPLRAEPQPPAWERADWVREELVQEGTLREQATAAARRAAQESTAPARRRHPGELAPDVVDDLQRAASPQTAARYQERLTSAAEALERGRYGDARRMVQPVLRDLPDLAAGHEVAGLALYRLGEWRKAASHLETARRLTGAVDNHPVLADCYRAMRRYGAADDLWRELREASPAPVLMAEGRIVAAGVLADQGDLVGALAVMAKAGEVPKKIREHHLRQWYVLGDLYDRSGEIIKARRFFGLVADHDREFADVAARLAALGR